MLLEGRELKKKILEELKEEIIRNNDKVGLAIIQVGNDKASDVYVGQKEKMARFLDFEYKHIKYDSDVLEEELIDKIYELNNDDNINGILVQLPIPRNLDKDKIINSIDYRKDVDGLTDMNIGRLVSGKECLVPCTPLGIINLLDYYNIDVEGKNIVVVGRSLLVGKPIATLLTNKNATVTICHSKTDNLSDYTKNADIVIVAIGKANFLTGDMIKENSIIIDVGINRVDGKLCGDVDFDDVKDKVSMITPVPGGVGQMTVASLAQNTYKAYKLAKEKRW